tara:strand:- start:112776 stop:114002 length:1227 start_codon:yes stop_codon:yes gene_type:complete
MSIKKYLRDYAEADIEFARHLQQNWQHVLCVPAFDEKDALPRFLASVLSEQGLLIILLINSPQSAENTAAADRTRLSATTLKQQYPLLKIISEHCNLLQFNSRGSHLLVVERYALPDKEGVGLARKIACDLACKLIHEKKVLSPWIHNTDADVILPDNYFKISQQLETDIAAALFAFKHEANPDAGLQHGLQLYEFSLYYYVEALLWAGSPYAFHTVGSTLLIHHNAYALSRGFPKRSAGEDFYLLNKLAKIGKIHSLKEPYITLSGRSSARVPFGTGPAITKINAIQQPELNYLYYHPQCFLHLKEWLGLMPTLWETGDLQKTLDSGLLLDCLTELGVEAAIAHALQHSKSQASFVKHMHNWFDAFRTLKLIHCLRNRKLRSINKNSLQALQNEFVFIESAAQALSD